MNADEKICPFCAETIKNAAIVCKHCGKNLQVFPQQSGTNIKRQQPLSTQTPKKRAGCLRIGLYIFAGMVVFGAISNIIEGAKRTVNPEYARHQDEERAKREVEEAEKAKENARLDAERQAKREKETEERKKREAMKVKEQIKIDTEKQAQRPKEAAEQKKIEEPLPSIEKHIVLTPDNSDISKWQDYQEVDLSGINPSEKLEMELYIRDKNYEAYVFYYGKYKNENEYDSRSHRIVEVRERNQQSNEITTRWMTIFGRINNDHNLNYKYNYKLEQLTKAMIMDAVGRALEKLKINRTRQATGETPEWREGQNIDLSGIAHTLERHYFATDTFYSQYIVFYRGYRIMESHPIHQMTMADGVTWVVMDKLAHLNGYPATEGNGN